MPEPSAPSPTPPDHKTPIQKTPSSGDVPDFKEATEEQKDSKYAFWLNTPWAKMFAAHGAAPTAEQMHAIMNGVMQATFHELQREEKHRKEVMKHMKEVIEGNE